MDELERTLEAVASLSHRERDLLMRSYGPEAESVEVLAARYGQAPSRIRTINEMTLRKLRHQIGTGS